MIKKLIKQFMKFFGVGLFGTIIDYSIFTITSLFGLQYLIATILGNIFGAIFNFILNKKFTFKNTTKNLKLQMAKYLLSIFLYIGGTFLLMWIAVDIFTFNKYISRFVVVGVMFVANFMINKWFVFKKEND